MELEELHTLDGNPLTAEALANLPGLLAAAKDLFSGEKREDWIDSEYFRGQLELIANVSGIDIDLAWLELPQHILGN